MQQRQNAVCEENFTKIRTTRYMSTTSGFIRLLAKPRRRNYIGAFVTSSWHECSEMDGNWVRHETIFVGRVQGVGFRATAQNIARRYPVVGFVQNLADGSVQLVIEGDPETCRQVVYHIADQMEDFIAERKMLSSDATGEFASFDIRD
ncbi:acylphosphatase [Blastopirellula marina]|uniref:acylphosphatase n=1 Tax=Blastopirellula marina TaxID=124 RepID=UPI001929ACFE|nr:acylphosphatase [Blastopirellula marina]